LRKDEQFAELVSLDEETQAFLAEAEKLLAGEEQ
jgi:hypothetical protein